MRRGCSQKVLRRNDLRYALGTSFANDVPGSRIVVRDDEISGDDVLGKDKIVFASSPSVILAKARIQYLYIIKSKTTMVRSL
jgi:hypothetical protein